MPEHYVTVNDFLAYDKQLMGKLGRIGDTVANVRDQVTRLNATFTDYRAETDAFRIQTRQDFAQVNHHLMALDTRINTLEQTFDNRINTLAQMFNNRMSTLEQTVTHGFALLFVHLGIQQPQ